MTAEISDRHMQPTELADAWRLRPRALRVIGDVAAQKGATDAMRFMLEQAAVDVSVESPTDVISSLANHNGSVLFVGDHSRQWEFVALMAVVASIGRPDADLKHVAKFYVQHQVAGALGERAAKAVLPVYPRILASDLPHGLDAEVLSRWHYRRHLLSAEDSRQHNQAVIGEAVKLLEDGHMVNIFPCGKITNAFTSPWRDGVGHILSGLSERAQADTLVCMYHCGGLSRTLFLAHVAMVGSGLALPAYKISMQMAEPLSAAGLLHDLPPGSARPAVATQSIRQRFIHALQPQSI